MFEEILVKMKGEILPLAKEEIVDKVKLKEEMLIRVSFKQLYDETEIPTRNKCSPFRFS